MYEQDQSWEGFEWVNADDAYRSIFSFIRHSKDNKKNLLFVCNFTPVARDDYLSLIHIWFKLAIDDFGTGYASLNMLSVVSGDILKIDKSLLESDNRRTRVIFEKVIEMAHSMDMKVVCEGV